MARNYGGCAADNRDYQKGILENFEKNNPFEFDDDGIRKKKSKKRKKVDDEEHEHHHHEEKHECCCGHHHEHEHHHHDEEHECCCGHHHEHDHDDGCGCGCHHHGSIKNEKVNNIVLIVRFVLSVGLLVGSIFTSGIINIIMLSVSYLVIAYDVLYSAIVNILHKEFFDENFLMSIASLTA